MRFVKKRTYGGYALERANENPPQDSEAATSRWSSFSSEGRRQVIGFLREEQFGLCAYSEVSPERLDIGMHIEHVQPKSFCPQRTFDFSNLVLNALSSSDLKNTRKENQFGGHARPSYYDENRFISCLREDCARFFAYDSLGQINPAEGLSQLEKEQAEQTIKDLNLRSPYLVELRASWIEELDKYIDEHLDNDDSLEDLAAIYLEPTSGQLDPFFSATKQRFSGFIG